MQDGQFEIQDFGLAPEGFVSVLGFVIEAECSAHNASSNYTKVVTEIESSLCHSRWCACSFLILETVTHHGPSVSSITAEGAVTVGSAVSSIQIGTVCLFVSFVLFVYHHYYYQ